MFNIKIILCPTLELVRFETTIIYFLSNLPGHFLQPPIIYITYISNHQTTFHSVSGNVSSENHCLYFTTSLISYKDALILHATKNYHASSLPIKTLIQCTEEELKEKVTTAPAISLSSPHFIKYHPP